MKTCYGSKKNCPKSQNWPAHEKKPPGVSPLKLTRLLQLTSLHSAVCSWPSAADVADTSVVMYLLCVKRVCTVGPVACDVKLEFYYLCCCAAVGATELSGPLKIALGREAWLCSFKMDGFIWTDICSRERREEWLGKENEKHTKKNNNWAVLCTVQCCHGACFSRPQLTWIGLQTL